MSASNFSAKTTKAFASSVASSIASLNESLNESPNDSSNESLPSKPSNTHSSHAQVSNSQLTHSSPYHFVSQAKLPTAHGDFVIHAFENEAGQEHVMLTVGLPCEDSTVIPLVRIHSECLTGDAFSSLKCDCGPQLNATMQAVQEHGCGAILYLRQEGRGIGLVNKIRAYALQDQGHDTLDANLMLGLPADARTYEMCKPMLDHVGITQLNLLTNNPNKLHYLEDLGFDIVTRVPLIVGVNPLNTNYLMTKQKRMGHVLAKDWQTASFSPISPTDKTI